MINSSDQLSKTKRAELRGVISTKPHLKRYLRTTPGGLLRIDAAAIKRETNLDGKYLLRTSDPTLSTEDIALGYKQLLEVERRWRDMKTVLDLRPVYHRREDRIRAHVLLCWLGLLLIRVAETRTARRWPDLHRELDRIHLGTFTGPAGTFRRRTDLTNSQTATLTALGLPVPPLITEATPQPPDLHRSHRLVTHPSPGQSVFPQLRQQIHRPDDNIICGTRDTDVRTLPGDRRDTVARGRRHSSWSGVNDEKSCVASGTSAIGT
jgi:hypothetical protein